jgi:hypothetical protein
MEGDGEFRIDGRTSVRQVLSRYPSAAEVFERHGIMGCGGPEGPDEPLVFFALVHKVDPERLIDELREHIAASQGSGVTSVPSSVCRSLSCPSLWPSQLLWQASLSAPLWPCLRPGARRWIRAGQQPPRRTASCSSWGGWGCSSWAWPSTSCPGSRHGPWPWRAGEPRWCWSGRPRSSCGRRRQLCPRPGPGLHWWPRPGFNLSPRFCSRLWFGSR